MYTQNDFSVTDNKSPSAGCGLQKWQWIQNVVLRSCTKSCVLSTDTERASHIKRKKQVTWASLVAQWLGIHLPMQGTRVRALVLEDPTCHGATKPVCHNYWAHVPQLLKPTQLEPVLRNKRSHRKEKPTHRTEE